jgi:hypothetical protein
MNRSAKKIRVERIKQFLDSFFPEKNRKYKELEVNGFTLIKSTNPTTKKSTVGIYTKESFLKYKQYELLTKR